MVSKQFNFSRKAIEELPIPARRAFYSDVKVPFLALMVTKTGAKSFKIRKKKNGQFITVTLGKFPEMTVEQARKKAVEAIAQIVDGQNPNDAKRKIREEVTFGEMHKEYIANYVMAHKKNTKTDSHDVPRLAGHLFTRKASNITKRELQALHTKIGNENGHYMANRIIEAIRATYNKNMQWGWEGKNPATGIDKFREKSRDRFLLPEEMPRFMHAVAQEENITARDFFYMALLTGARKTNVLSMKWDQMDFVNCLWRIPETKNGDSQLVVLPPPAIQLLQQRKINADSEWVFPGEGNKGHFSDPKKAWRRILKDAGIAELRIHDLRRTLGSWQAAMGANTYIIGKSLGHKSPEATAIYARLNLDPVRESVTKATAAMFNITTIPMITEHA